MSWKPLPRGSFTGIDWSAPGALDGMDPYLAWAEADGFVGYQVPGRPPEQPHWLPLVIGLREGADVMARVNACDTAWLRVPQAYGLVPGLRYGLGHDGDSSVIRRSYSALMLAEILGRDNDQQLLSDSSVLEWGDRATS